jgi:hypothetical protein
MSGMTQMLGGAGGPNAAAAQAMFGSMRMYQKNGAKYSVMLMDIGGLAKGYSQSTGQQLPGGGMPPGMGDFTMAVIRLK